MLPHERKLLTDQQLRDASRDQIENLIQRLNLILREREEPGQLVWSLTSEEPARRDPAPRPLRPAYLLIASILGFNRGPSQALLSHLVVEYV